MKTHIPDNPVYNILNGVRRNYAISIGSLKVYQPEVLHFGDFKDLRYSENALFR